MSEEGEVVVDSPASSPEVETEARQFGWVAKDEFKGDEADWRPADEFLKRGKEINGFLRKNNEKLEEKNARLAREIAEIRATMDEFREYHQTTLAEAKKNALAELRQQKAVAVEQGDGAKLVEIDEKIDQIKNTKDTPEKSESKKTVEPIFTPNEYREWQSKNLWYGTNLEVSEFVDEVADILVVRNPNLRGPEFLDALTKRVKKEYPDLFENPARNNADVSGSSASRPATNGKKKSYENLPPEAKVQCDKFVANKVLTREQYIADFQWEE